MQLEKKKIEARCGDSYLSFLPRQRQEDLYELEASLVYKSVSGQVGLLQKETLSQKTKSNSNFHCQETPLTGKFSSSGESSLGDESEAYFPPKLCLSEDKLGWGSEPEGWVLSGCESVIVGPTPMQMRITKWLLLIFFCSTCAPRETRRGTVWTWRKTRFYIFRNVRFS